MSFRKVLATNQPGGLVLLRFAVGAVCILEGMRLCGLFAPAGPSRLGDILGFGATSGMVVGVVLLCAGAGLIVGLCTRIGALVAVVLGGLAAYTAHKGLGGVDTPREFSDIASAGCVALVACYLVIHGAGVWSIDATLGLPKRS